MTAPTPSPVTEHLRLQLEREETALGTALAGDDLSAPTTALASDISQEDPELASLSGTPNLTELTGLETMARPWRLFLLGLGAGVGLIAWLIVANGQSTLSSPLVSVAAFVSTLFVGIGLLAVANERDRLGPATNVLSAAVGLAFGVVVWLNPTPLMGIDRWETSQRMLVALVASGAGLVLAGVICLATLRRSPTITVALTILSGVSVLTAVTAVRQNEWLGIILFSLAFFLVLGAWDRSPRREVAFSHPPDAPRAARAALSLSILALSGTAIDYARHAENRGSWSGVGIAVAIALIAYAIAVLFRLRSDLENRETRVSDWKSWTREIRTNEFRRGFESMAARSSSPADAPFADLGEPLRPESDAALAEPSAAVASPYSDLGAAAMDTPAAHGDSSPPYDFAAAGTTDATPSASGFDFANAAEGAWRPSHSGEPPANPPAAAGTESPGTLSSIVDEPVWADPNTQREVPAITIPTADVDAVDESPAELYRAPRPTGNGTFSVFAQPEPVRLDVVQADAFASWLETTPSRPALFVAVECMYLASFAALSPPYKTRVIAEVAAKLGELTPQPDPVAWIDGPYFLAAIPACERRDLLSLNRQLQTLLGLTLTFDEVDIPLCGTLALLTPRETITFDELLDDAVNGLIHARQLEI